MSLRSIRLLLRNGFRNAKRTKMQIIGLTLLIMLISLLTSISAHTKETVIGGSERLKIESKQNDFIFSINPEYRLQQPEEKKLPENQTLVQQYYVNELSQKEKYDFSWSRTEGRIFSNVTNDGEKLNIKALAKTNVSGDEDFTNDINVDSLVISQGRNFSTSTEMARREIIINENFAKANNLELNDIIRVQLDKQGDSLNVRDNPEVKKNLEGVTDIHTQLPEQYKKYYWMQIVGFGTSADFLSPIIDETSIIPNSKTNMIAYVHPSHFGLVADKESSFYLQSMSESSLMPTSSFGTEIYYSARFNSTHYDLETIDNEFKTITNNNAGNTKVVYGINDEDYKFVQRTKLLDQIVIGYKVGITVLLVIVTGISLFALVIMIKKQVEIYRTQLGILKAMGLRKTEIVNNFVAIPMISGAMGVILGYGLAFVISPLIMDMFSSFFSLTFTLSSFSVISLVNSIFTTWFGLLVITFLCIYLTIKDSPSKLLAKMNPSSIGWVQMKIKNIGSNRKKFEPRLRLAVVSTSWQKYLGTLLTILVSTFILSITVITPRILETNKTKAFDGLNYQNKVEYIEPIAANPLSFFKTYNPDKNNKAEGWGFPTPENAEDKRLQVSTGGVGGGSFLDPNPSTLSYTSSPVINVSNENVFDTNKIYDQFLNGDISNFYYNHDIPLDSTTAWAKLGFSDWTTFSTGFFKALDSLPNIKTPSGLIGSIAMNSLLTQWTDYTNLKRDITNLIKETNKSKTVSREQLILFNKYMLDFYQKYISGPPLTVNPDFIKKDAEDNEKVNVKTINDKIKRSHFLFGGKGKLYEDPKLYSEDLKIIKTENGHDLELKIDNQIIDLIDLSNSELLNEDNWSNNNISEINRHLVSWFISVIDNRIGVAILETGYSRAPYFIQEYMKDAIVNDKDYGLGFNLIPFNPFTDTRGTMLSAYLNDEKIKIHGINEDNNMIDFGPNKNKLFDYDQNDDYVPIIINESVAKKFEINRNELVQLVINNDTIEVRENKEEKFKILRPGDVEVGAKNRKKEFQYEEFYRPNSAKSIQSTDGKNFADASILSLSPVEIGGSNITATTSSGSTDQTEVHKKFSEGNLIIGSEYLNKTFRVVGIQKSYGELQAWVSNDQANKIKGYDKAQSQMFANWFSPESVKNKDYINWLSKGNDEAVVQSILEEIIKIIKNDEYKNTLTQYDVFKSKMNEAVGESYDVYQKIDKSFNNAFPVFNYKYSLDPEVKDLTRGLSTSQRFSDFSAQGMNGNYVLDPETGEPNFNKFVEGYGASSFNTMVPLSEAKQILSQITDVVSIIVIGLITLATLVATIIILLVTILVISENKEFLATMKLMGYSDHYVLRQILTPYIIGMLIVYILGFVGSWFFFVWGIDLVAQNTSFVMPVSFEFWMPLMVFGILFLIYLSTMLVTYKQIKKIKPSLLLS